MRAEGSGRCSSQSCIVIRHQQVTNPGPTPTSTPPSAWSSASGLAYEVGPLGTTFEGPADLVWATLRAAHEAALASGAEANMTHVRLIERPGSDATMGSLTAPHRP